MKLSIIMAMYNAEKYIKPCLESILNQTFKDFELIIVDDGSKDGSAEIVKKYGEIDKRIKYHYQENQSACVALNNGIGYAKGEYLTFVDNDDIVEIETYEKVSNLLDEFSADIVVYGYYQEFIDEGYSTICKPDELYASTYEECQNIVVNIFENGVFHPFWNKWYRRELILINDINFDSRFNSMGDYSFNCRLFQHAKNIATLDFVGYHYLKRNRDSLVTNYVKNMVPCFEERRRLTRELFDYYDLWCLESAKNYYITQYYFESEDFLINLYKPKCDLDKNEKCKLIDKYILDKKSKEYYDCFKPNTIYAKIFLFSIKSNSASFIGFVYTTLTVLKNSFFGVYKVFRKQQYKKYK
ncbi:MAG: glycosyltransferase family 2 protein [Anaerorhabdus sp.]|uniref:glycosyltransferase family 2 protein n=1 Tax=Anaerorhabdus sp. TaxID=1872524 RepID=UPI002FC98AA1